MTRSDCRLNPTVPHESSTSADAPTATLPDTVRIIVHTSVPLNQKSAFNVFVLLWRTIKWRKRPGHYVTFESFVYSDCLATAEEMLEKNWIYYCDYGCYY